MKKLIKKDIEINEGLFVIHNILDALIQKYNYSIPKRIERKLICLMNEIEKIIYVDDKISKNYDLNKDKLIRRVELEYVNFTKKL